MDYPADETIRLTRDLIRCESVSPVDAGCQDLIADILDSLGFSIERMPFGDVSNLWATRTRGEGPVFTFAGHTDVVPAGPLDQWETPPFEPVVRDGYLYGRGAADMKGSLAAMVTAVRRFIDEQDDYQGTIAFLVTSDEESDAIDGTARVIETLEERGVALTWCLVGEPSSTSRLGDVVRVGRRGSLSATLTVRGVQGHVAYPDDAVNPIHTALPALSHLCATKWDGGNRFFPPTTMQISSIHSGTGAGNIIPGELKAAFNFRFSPESTVEDLKSRTTELLDGYGLDYSLDWFLSGHPFLTDKGALVSAVETCIREETGISPELSTSGGTSDGRFIAPTGTEVVELGPCNDTIHKVNERVSIDELLALSRLYTRILDTMLG